MDHLPRVNILHSFNELVDVVASLYLVQALASFDQVRKRLVLADVKHNVHILFILEVAIETHDVLMVQRSVDLNLTSELLTGLSSGQIGLRDNFESPSTIFVFFSLDRLNSFHLVALGETSLA